MRLHSGSVFVRFPARHGVAPGIERGELGFEEQTDYATTE
jgi:hypothetical protein